MIAVRWRRAHRVQWFYVIVGSDVTALLFGAHHVKRLVLVFLRLKKSF